MAKKAPPAPEPFEVRHEKGQTVITVYPLKKRVGFAFRYYLGGKARTVERREREEIVKEALRIAGGIDAGLVQVGKVTAADMESYVHAVAQLGPGSPPLHAIVAEWKAAREVLGDNGTLVEAARMWVDRTGANLSGTRTVGEVVEELIETRTSGRRHYDPNGLATVCRRLRVFAVWCGKRPITTVTERDIEKYLSTLDVAPRTRHNYRTTIITLFRFARRRRYVAEDRESEAEKVEKEHWIDAAPTVWTPGELRSVLAHVSPRFLPWIVLGAFAGIRTEEICGDRHDPKQQQLEWRDVFFDEREILIRPEVGKTDEGRLVPITDNLFAWLARWRGRTGPIIAPGERGGLPNYAEETARLRNPSKKINIRWRRNALRHSYASYRYAIDRNLDHLTAVMGNSASINRKHYQSPRFTSVAKEWFEIMPPRGDTIIKGAFGK